MPQGNLPENSWMFKPISAETLFRFWAKVDMCGPDECWPWQGARSGKGYGFLKLYGHMVAAHRFAFVLTKGCPWPSIFILHSCDNPPCCNSTHLWAGTHLDNCRDAVAKHRNTFGEHNGLAKLTAIQAKEVRERYATGEVTEVLLARMFDVSQTTISCIIRGKRYTPPD